MRIAIVGAGIAGLGTAWLLHRQGHTVTLFEADARPGGHTATVDVTLDGHTFPVDTGFLVYNDRTYPRLVALFRELGIESVASEMSFSCRVDRAGLEWSGTSLSALFAQPRNALRPAFWRMLADIVRFNREASALAGDDAIWSISLGEYLDARHYGAAFRDWYLLPMAAAIWSSPRRDILDFPLRPFVRFCANHGLLQLTDRPLWRTVRNGARDLRRPDRGRARRRAACHARAAHRAPLRPRHRGHARQRRGALRRSGAGLPQRAGAGAARRSLAARKTACWPTCATSPIARYCIRIPRCCRARAARGPHGTTSPSTMPAARARSRCRISSTSCSRCLVNAR